MAEGRGGEGGGWESDSGGVVVEALEPEGVPAEVEDLEGGVVFEAPRESDAAPGSNLVPVEEEGLEGLVVGEHGVD